MEARIVTSELWNFAFLNQSGQVRECVPEVERKVLRANGFELIRAYNNGHRQVEMWRKKWERRKHV
jgi:hypothetical protein